jgi:eukaryotic-like serine/threonine-protein kinase
MPSYIDLYREASLGRFTIPDQVKSDNQNSYRLKRATLGGGNGIVFTADRIGVSTNNIENYAIKLLRQLSSARVDRFQNEIRVLQELDSKYISKFYDSGEVEVVSQSDPTIKEKIPWVAMQLGSENMRQHIEKRGKFTLSELKSVALHICYAVRDLHEKEFIHRDIKPDNFVWLNEKRDSLLMIDFGIAKRLGENVASRLMDTFTQVTEFVGPVFFSSPELIEYSRDKQYPVDYRSDIFQIGKLLWYLGTGKISAGVPSRKECPADGRLRNLVIEMIDDDPAGRPQVLEEIIEKISAL